MVGEHGADSVDSPTSLGLRTTVRLRLGLLVTYLIPKVKLRNVSVIH